jgi:mannosyltransferase
MSQAPARPGLVERAHHPLRRVDPAIVALTALGFALASYRLGAKSMWLDEAVSADHARLGLHGLWTVVSRTDPNMGLYYVLLHLWVRVFGYGEAAVRSMTVVLAGLAVPVMALLGKRLYGRACGLVAGLLLALSPFFVQYEQTARSYAVVVLLVLLSSYFFVAALERPSRATLIGYVLASALAVYTHYFAALVLLVQLVTLLAVKRRGALTREWLAAAIAVVVLCAPEVVFAHRAGTQGIAWIHEPTLSALVHFPSELAGETVLAAVLVVLACYGLVRAATDREGWRTGFLTAWLVVPVVLDFTVSKLGHPLFVTYYLIVVLPPFLLLAALGVLRLPRGPAAAIALGLLVAFSAVGIRAWYARPSLEDYRGATRYLLANERREDGIIDYPTETVSFGIAYYEALAGAGGPTPVGFVLGRAPFARPPRIWLVMRDSDVPVRERRRVERSMSGQYVQVGTPAVFRNITMILYRLESRASGAIGARRPPRSRAREVMQGPAPTRNKIRRSVAPTRT